MSAKAPTSPPPGPKPEPPPPAPRRAERFFDTLADAVRAAGPQLSPMESRLVAIASQLLPQMVVQVRCADHTRPPVPLSAEVVEWASRLSLVGAAEMEAQLHRMRDAMAGAKEQR